MNALHLATITRVVYDHHAVTANTPVQGLWALRWPVICLTVMGAAGCSGGAGSGDDPERERGELVAISITPFSPTLSVGGSQDFVVRGFFEDESSTLLQDVTWYVDDTRVMQIDAAGEATALAVGSVTLVANASNLAARTTVQVRGESDEPTLIQAVPSSVQLAVGETLGIQAVATYDDGDTGDIAAQCGWTTSDAAIATVSDGVVTAVRPGEATLTIDCGPRSPSPVPVTVRDDSQDIPLPDLQVTFFDAETHGGTIDYSVVVSNTGAGNANGFWVDLFADSAAAPTQSSSIDDLAWVPGLAAGSSIPLELAVYAPGSTNRSWVAVDIDERIEESSNSNNVRGPLPITVSAGLPDLVITSAEAVTDGFSTLYEVTVANTGAADASGFWVDLFLDPAADPVVDETGYTFEWVDTLAAGDDQTLEFFVDDAPLTSWSSVVFADTNAHVDESDESNNQLRVSVTP